MSQYIGLKRATAKPGVRVALILLSIVVLMGLLVWFGSLEPSPAAGDYPNGYHLSVNYDAYVGEQASFTAIVAETDPIIVHPLGDDEFRMTVRSLELDVARGERIRLFAIVEPGRTLTAVDAFTVSSSRLVRTYVVSFLAGLWALARLVRDWRIDTSNWALVPRHLRNQTDTEDGVSGDA